jgi:hypothetical protein
VALEDAAHQFRDGHLLLERLLTHQLAQVIL